MSAVSNLGAACGCERRRLPVGGKGPGTASPGSVDRRAAALRVAWRRQDGAYTVQLSPSNSRMKALASRSRFCTRMALLDEKIFHNPDSAKSSGVLSYDLIQGDLVKWNSFMDKSVPDPPTAVLLHGILGGRKNWGSFARRLAQEFPMWQFLLVDLRCHGDSTSIKKRGPHTVASAALDVLKLVGQLRVTPRVLVGHSFGGKVALSMVEQAAKPLARPVKVWVLDATPGKLRPGGDGEDHPGELIEFLSSMPTEVSSKQEIINTLVEQGFSLDVARWVATNLRPVSRPSPLPSAGFSWVFDLKGIAEMYKSYEKTNLWEIVKNVPRGVRVNFLKAERSLHRWALEDLQRIHAAEELAADEGAGVQMHVLEDAGHWMTREAILALHERTGSGSYAIAKYVKKHQSVLSANFKKMVAVQLRNSTVKGKLVKVKASFKLTDAGKKDAQPGKEKKVVKKEEVKATNFVLKKQSPVEPQEQLVKL